MTDIMIDLETLGTGHDAYILSIGACDVLNSNRTFYVNTANTNQDRAIDVDTVTWWMQQSEEARKVFTEDSIVLPAALRDLADWMLDGTEPGDLKVWSHGATFDIPILQHAYKQYKIDCPWGFWNARDTRTVYDLTGLDVERPERKGTHHNALDDALWQSEYLRRCFEHFGV